MRDMVLQMGISIDGYVSGGPGEDIGGGEAEHPDVVARKMAWVSQAGLHAMGRVTYDEMSGFWPTSTSEYAKPMNEIPKVVFSTTLTQADWPSTTIASGDLEEEITKLKAEPGGDVIAYGGYTFVQALTRANLVDEYRLVTRPVALGSGEPMFKSLPVGRRLELAEVTPYPDGTVISVYRRRSSGPKQRLSTASGLQLADSDVAHRGINHRDTPLTPSAQDPLAARLAAGFTPNCRGLSGGRWRRPSQRHLRLRRNGRGP